VLATVVPERTFLSEVPQIIGGIGGGMVPAGPFTPLTAGAGSALMETGVLGAEQLMGWPPAEPGGPVNRVGRAFTRGAAGEGITRAGIAGYRALTRGARPVMEAAETLKPVLTREVPKDLVFGPRGLAGPQIAVDALVKDPAMLAKMGTELTPEMQQTVLTRWWQTNAEGGPQQVIKAWDALGTVEGAQQALAGAYHGPLTAMVDTLRGVGKLPQTYGELLRAGPLATAALMTGHPYVAGATGLLSSVLPREAPRLFLHPGPAAFLTALPQMARQAAPVVRFGLRTAAQLGTGELERQPGGAFGWQVPEAAP
jgi:hypothetical protein